VGKDIRAVKFTARWETLFVLDLYYLATLIIPTVTANVMGKTRFSAIGALDKISCLQGMMSPTAISTPGRKLLFWKGCH
jgi:hypothetical protein